MFSLSILEPVSKPGNPVLSVDSFDCVDLLDEKDPVPIFLTRRSSRVGSHTKSSHI